MPDNEIHIGWIKTLDPKYQSLFYGTLIFQQSSIICIGRHVGGHTLALQWRPKQLFA